MAWKKRSMGIASGSTVIVSSMHSFFSISEFPAEKLTRQ